MTVTYLDVTVTNNMTESVTSSDRWMWQVDATDGCDRWMWQMDV